MTDKLKITHILITPVSLNLVIFHPKISNPSTRISFYLTSPKNHQTIHENEGTMDLRPKRGFLGLLEILSK